MKILDHEHSHSHLRFSITGIALVPCAFGLMISSSPITHGSSIPLLPPNPRKSRSPMFKDVKEVDFDDDGNEENPEAPPKYASRVTVNSF